MLPDFIALQLPEFERDINHEASAVDLIMMAFSNSAACRSLRLLCCACASFIGRTLANRIRMEHPVILNFKYRQSVFGLWAQTYRHVQQMIFSCKILMIIVFFNMSYHDQKCKNTRLLSPLTMRHVRCQHKIDRRKKMSRTEEAFIARLCPSVGS